MNDEFKNEVFSRFDPNPARACSHCDKKPVLALAMLNPRTGRTLRMYKCHCGEQTWAEHAVTAVIAAALNRQTSKAWPPQGSCSY